MEELPADAAAMPHFSALGRTGSVVANEQCPQALHQVIAVGLAEAFRDMPLVHAFRFTQ
ncbi:hypothetical protein SAMN04490356_0815 [Streptomyces melanosporofaciens]|uniref:Uncharacterized protein n=1 Tax=Streptomyces melanosporofaciens TaxID=67327 RepID=A0A1H4KLF7_STRMJ|nr:hypothetical protein SAMN04490356_0815 [Streptomyces melanosporofaciens]